jgi:hypothetical protein
MLRLTAEPKSRDTVDRTASASATLAHLGARESLCEELFRSPSILGRIVAIVCLFDEQTGRYRHRLSERFGIEEIDEVLRRLHREVFASWLNLPLRQQQADVAVYLATLGEQGQPMDLEALGRRCIPPALIWAERDLFLNDLALIDALLRYDYGLAFEKQPLS